jgi:hypothetical protein
MKDDEYKNFVKARDRYTTFKQNVFEPTLKRLENNFYRNYDNLKSDLQIEINKEIERYKNMSKIDKLLNRLNIQNKSNPNLSMKSHFTNNNPYDLSGFNDLFTKPNTSLQPTPSSLSIENIDLNSSSSSINSYRTINPNRK